MMMHLHRNNKRQGPGSEDATNLAVTLAKIDREKSYKIADIGCGTGEQTISLAKMLKGNIIAVDLFEEFLEKLKEDSKNENITAHIETLAASMDKLPFEKEEFDIIWSEGAVYNIGFKNGINYWKEFLKPGGILAVSELSWITNCRPKELEDFWNGEYAEMDTIAGKIKALEEAGYKVLGHFILPDYAVEFKGPEKKYLPITGLPQKGVNQLFACAVQYPSLHHLMERYARLAMRQYEQYTNLSDELCALPGSFAVFALGMLGQEWRQLVWDYLDLCDDEHSRLQEKFLREYVKQFGFTADTVPVFVRGVLSMQDMKYSKDYAAWMANAESLGALLETKSRLSEIVPSGFSSDEDDDEDDTPSQETEASPEEVLQYAWETVCYVIWGKNSAKGGQKVVDAAPEELKEMYRQVFINIKKERIQRK